jgi:hypothetical protein
MNCIDTNELIRGERLGALSDVEQIEFEAHLELCARCRELVHPDLYADRIQPPEQLLGSILEATSGPACGRAGELLAQQFDGDLPLLDRRLVDDHADDCPACDSLRAAFACLAEDLRALRELEPDASFATDLFARTSRSRNLRKAPASVGLLRAWKSLIQRPRIAWETAYVGAMLFWLVLGLPFVGFPGTPPNLHEYLPQASGTRSVVRSLRDPISNLGRTAWVSALAAGPSRSAKLRQNLQTGVNDLRTAVESLDVNKGGQAVLAITEDAREVVHQLI